MKKALAVMVTCMVILVSSAAADIPKLINYQGMLTNGDGDPLDGTFDVFFRIYNAPSGGDKRWEENHSALSVNQGLFNVILGSQSGGIDLDFSEQYWLEVEVEGEIMPRIEFTSVGYSYRALVADSAEVAGSGGGGGGGWVDDGNAVRLEGVFDSVGIGTAYPSAKLHVVGDVNASGWYEIAGSPVLSREGSGNIFVGAGAGVNSTGIEGSFVGLDAGKNNGGHYNTFLGTSAGQQAGAGGNTYLGHNAGKSDTSGFNNTFVGQLAGYSNKSGSSNTFIGRGAGHSNISGNYNVFIGNHAGYNETGSNKLYVANSSTDPPLLYGDFSTGSLGITTTNPGQKLDVDLGNMIIQGTGSFDANGEEGIVYLGSVHHYIKGVYGFGVKIGTYAAGDVVSIKELSGNVGIGTTDPGSFKLAVNGDAAKSEGGTSWAVFSDARLKEIGQRYEYGLSEIGKLVPIRYRYKQSNELGLPCGQEQIGLLAQEVQDVIPDAVTENDQGYLMLNSDPIIWAMLNAIKELKAENEELKQRIEALEDQW
jgi:hypothetical protein